MKKCLFLLFCAQLAWGAPNKTPPAPNYLQIKLENQEQELHQLQRRLDNQDITLDAIRKEVHALKEKNNNKEINALSQRIDQLVEDVKNLHSFLEKTDKELHRQHSALTDVHSTLKTVAQALDEPVAEPSEQFYIVQTGDTLGEIASKNKTTIKKIKELNAMTKDTIFVGQKLRISK